MKVEIGTLDATPSKRLFLSIIADYDDEWKKITHFSDLRNKLIHQRATGSVSEGDLQTFRDLVESFVKKLYELKFPRS